MKKSHCLERVVALAAHPDSSRDQEFARLTANLTPEEKAFVIESVKPASSPAHDQESSHE